MWSMLGVCHVLFICCVLRDRGLCQWNGVPVHPAPLIHVFKPDPLFNICVACVLPFVSEYAVIFLVKDLV